MKSSHKILLKWALFLQSAIGASALLVPPLKPHNQMPTAFHQLIRQTPQLQLRERARGGGSSLGAAEGVQTFALIIVAVPVIIIGSVFGLLLQATMHYAGLSPGTRVAVEVCVIGLGMMLFLVTDNFKAETGALLLSIPAVGFFSMIVGVAIKIVSELAKRV